MISKIFFTVTFLFFSLSCTSLIETKTEKDLNLNLSTPGKEWHKIEKDLSDSAFMSSKTKSIIYINSHCKKYLNSPLKSLYHDLYGGLKSTQLLSQKTIQYKGRDALFTQSKISLDGVNRFLATLLTKKDRCLYDFVLISQDREIFERDLKKFNDYLNIGLFKK